MQIDGISLVHILGIINFILLLFQMFSGQHWIHVKFGIHRKVGLVFVATASLHGFLAFVTAN
ncbi:MAG: hypothetical protein KJ900_10550 [Proteobacteria bacterium]|nr:hypothetical protein [Desulfocapsa sp.]MBU3944072.1 hypothetical protein [Pseudomonadota bacterium]MDO8945579.1 hypothetical protein [Desulfocapsaceae bacterium]MBU3982074.1 hypothetical protein [Pseudomonadota bacterium]MBU4029541.1 hypothetical protein [Pseudomonadota bacterium]